MEFLEVKRLVLRIAFFQTLIPGPEAVLVARLAPQAQ
jgi:hypothetical protein